MQELQFARREDDALIVTNDAGEQFRIAIDEYLISEMKQLARPERSGPRVKPREIQSLIRAGKTRAEVVAVTGAEESDVERHEGPVLAERRYILENAQQVPVRTQGEPADDTPQTFGAVITARLTGLGAEDIEWTAWRDEADGWMISLDFRSREVTHQAVWSFEHRKALLAPLTSDAVTLSKQGDVGDRLIPKLRAVDTPERTERFDSGAFDPKTLEAHDLGAAAQNATTPLQLDGFESEPTAAQSDSSSQQVEAAEESAESAYERRQEIDQRAISSREEEPSDLGQTADLLDALRRRRGEREASRPEVAVDAEPLPRLRSAQESALAAPPVSPETAADLTKPAPLQAAPVAPTRGDAADAEDSARSADAPNSAPTSAKQDPAPSPAADTAGAKKRRTSIPSWDDILFGTRSEDDPA